MINSEHEASVDIPARNSALASTSKPNRVLKKRNQIPDSISQNEDLKRAISVLPSNYNFEIFKTVWRVKSEEVRVVALQFPEGLLMYACIIADIIERFTGAKPMILGDVTYGACCVDDFTAAKLGAQFLVHYGHSCLVPVSTTSLKVLYVFVEIAFDPSHLAQLLPRHFQSDTRLALMGTVQFTAVAHQVLELVRTSLPRAFVPQEKPLSSGETLGCTSPPLPPCDALVFLADGRFHLESAMIRNPEVTAYRYDPYSKHLTIEGYDTDRMRATRWKAIEAARTARMWGVVLGTLGRQGSPEVFQRIRVLLEAAGRKAVPFLMAELLPAKLRAVPTIEAWVQVACPRLSIDWGEECDKPLLTPYELEVALGWASWQAVYPMDYYSADGGSWTSAWHKRSASTHVSSDSTSPVPLAQVPVPLS